MLTDWLATLWAELWGELRPGRAKIELMRPTVYIETTVPSYYCDNRGELVAHIARTRQWWDYERKDYECFISEVVLSELEESP